MTPLFLYLLKVNIALVLFYLAYRYGLRRLTFYTLNRFYLLFAIGFSSVYPLIDVSLFLPDRSEPGGRIIYYLPNLGQLAQESPLELWNLLTLVFWSGVVVMAIRFALQCISLARIHFTSVKQEMETQDLRIVNDKINPFSFFRIIYINPLLHSAEEQRAIIAHEKVHAKELHTVDILAGELNRIFYWFNPGAWLMITAIRENLEFITDRRVLRGGTDAKAYQYSLVKASNIPYASSLANNFNFSHLKIRITMMDKKPSSELHLVKYLVLVPFVAAMALAFNVTRAAFTPPVIVKANESLIMPSDTLPEKAPKWETNKALYKDNFTGYTDMASISHIGAKDPVVLNGQLTNGQKALEAARRDGIDYAAKLENELAQYYVPGKNTLYWLETKRSGKATNRPDFPPPPEVKQVRIAPPTIVPKKGKDNDSIPPPEVKEVKKTNTSKASTMPPEKVVTGYPSPKANRSNKNTAAASEVIHVGYFELDPSDEDWEIMKDTLPPEVFEMMEATHKRKTGSDIKQKDPLIILDGNQVDRVDEISPDDIASMSVLKNDHATSLYGKKGENGVILITSKKNAAERLNQPEVSEVETKTVPRIKLRSDNGLEDALYVVDGEITSAEELEKISPDDIFSIDVLKDKSATDKYGEQGKSGAIEITTKE